MNGKGSKSCPFSVVPIAVASDQHQRLFCSALRLDSLPDCMALPSESLPVTSIEHQLMRVDGPDYDARRRGCREEGERRRVGGWLADR